MNFDSFKDLLLTGTVGILIAIIGYGVHNLVDILKKMLESINELNHKIAEILGKLNSHEDRIKKLEGKE